MTAVTGDSIFDLNRMKIPSSRTGRSETGNGSWPWPWLVQQCCRPA